MLKNRLFSLLAFISLVFGACNNDIFVDAVPDLEEDSYHLLCDGNAVSFKIPTKGLRDVSFNCEHSTIANVTYYDKHGESIYNPSLSNVAKAVYSSPLFCLDFDVDGDQIKVT
ncbi:MAG: hypothetical protein NC453_19075, partial [Muribaculum sp.]|nr:hypothetical protein [Muribaculum sp.]